MKVLSQEYAINLVRKNLDEQEFNSSSMLNGDVDNSSLNMLITKTLPTAINEVHQLAPVQLLEGENVLQWVNNCAITDEVFSFSLECKFLRLVIFQATDSPYIITTPVREDSPEGLMQLNEFTRGSYDSPILVLSQGDVDTPRFKYYSIKNTNSDPQKVIKRLDVILKAEDNHGTYNVSSNLLEAIISQLTGMVLSIYNEFDKAKYFFELVNSQIK